MSTNRSKTSTKSRLTEAQLLALIPAGPSTPQRRAHDRIEVEPVAEGASGDAIVTRERVVNPIMKLHQTGDISIEAVAAAVRYRTDFERAYASSTNVLSSTAVDGKGDPEHAMLNKVSHASRHHDALAALGVKLALVAQRGILESRSFGDIGALFRPDAKASNQSRDGKKLLIKALGKLTEFYAASEKRSAS